MLILITRDDTPQLTMVTIASVTARTERMATATIALKINKGKMTSLCWCAHAKGDGDWGEVEIRSGHHKLDYFSSIRCAFFLTLGPERVFAC